MLPGAVAVGIGLCLLAFGTASGQADADVGTVGGNLLGGIGSRHGSRGRRHGLDAAILGLAGGLAEGLHFLNDVDNAAADSDR